MKNILIFDHANILVVGDIMLDRYKYGDVDRISPEAPVPVVRISGEDIAPGGAANVAVNLRGLGCQVELIGYIGIDNDGQELISEIARHGVGYPNIISSTAPTISKTRIIAGRQHIVRYDNDSNINTNKHRDEYEKTFISRLIDAATERVFDVVVISDYAKGTITDEVMKTIKSLFLCPIICDIKPVNMELFHDVFCITPNIMEARQLVGIDNDKSLPELANLLKRKLNLKTVIITLSQDGIFLLDQQNRTHLFKAHVSVDYNDPCGRLDVTGAGDTVLSTLAACISMGHNIQEAVQLSNLAAGVVVRRIGTATCSVKDLNIAYL